VVLLLADERIDVNRPENEGATPFYIACEAGHKEVVVLLLADERIDVTQRWTHDGGTGFSQACQNGHCEVVKLLLEDWRICTTPMETNTGCTPLWNAAHFGELRIVEQLLASEREIDTTTRSIEGDEAWNGITPGEIAGSGDYNHDVFDDSEAETISNKRQRNGRFIQQLIDAHELDPRGVSHQLREKPEHRGQMK